MLVATFVMSLWLWVVQAFPGAPVASFVPLMVAIACYLFRDPCLFLIAPGLMALVLGFYIEPNMARGEPSPVDLVIFAATFVIAVMTYSMAYTRRMEQDRIASGTTCFVMATIAGIIIGVSVVLALSVWCVVLIVQYPQNAVQILFTLCPLSLTCILAGYVFSLPIGVAAGVICTMLPEIDYDTESNEEGKADAATESEDPAEYA